MAYPTAAELVAESTVAELLALDGAQQEGLRQAAILAVEEFTGQKFEPVVETRNLRGTRKRQLYLPARLEALAAITVTGVALTGVTVSDDGDFIELPPTAGTGYYEQALRDVSGERFFAFNGKLAITGTWGWTVCPEGVALALRYDIEEQALADANQLSPTIAAYRKLGVRSVSQGNLRVQIGDDVVLSPRVQRQLSRYVWNSPGELV